MFEILVWFAIEYGKTDYRKVDLSNMTSEDKDIFNKYIKSKSYNDTERNIENETMIQPFTIDNEEFFKEENNDDINRYEQDIFETKEEFHKRIKDHEIFTLGRIFIKNLILMKRMRLLHFHFLYINQFKLKYQL